MKSFGSIDIKKIILTISIFSLFSYTLNSQSKNSQSKTQDSLRVLIVKYDNPSSGLDGVVTFSAVMEKDSAIAPIYLVQDSVVQFISEFKVDAVNKIVYVSPDKISKKDKKTFPNGFVKLELKPGEQLHYSQVLPTAKNTQRQVFVTRLSLSQLDNSSGKFSALAKEYVDSYGTDDQVFRTLRDYEKNATPIIAIDSLNNKCFVESVSDFRAGTIETIDAYDAVNAMKIIGDKGVDGLFVVIIKSQFTLKEALLTPFEKVKKQAKDLDGCNFTTLILREPILIK